MSRRKITVGTTNFMFGIFVRDTSSTTGAGLAGLTHTTPGLIAEYRREGQATWTSIPLVGGTLGSYLSGSLVADGALAGAYEFDPPNACFLTGATWVKIRLRGAANMLPVLAEFELDQLPYQDAIIPVDVQRWLDKAVQADASDYPFVAVSPGGISNTSLTTTAYSAIAAAVWAVLTSTLTAAGTIGKLIVDNLNATVGSRSTQTSVDTLIGRITAPVAQMFQDLIAMILGSGTANAQWDAKSLELAPSGGGGGDASQATLLEVKAKTDLLVVGQVNYTGMVDEKGEIRHPIFIGDDYLAVHSKAFTWDINAIPGLTAATAIVKFGGVNALLGKSWLVTGTATDLGGGRWRLTAQMDDTVTGLLLPGLYDWTVEVSNAGGTEMTVVYSDRKVEVRSKPT